MKVIESVEDGGRGLSLRASMWYLTSGGSEGGRVRDMRKSFRRIGVRHLYHHKEPNKGEKLRNWVSVGKAGMVNAKVE